MILRWVPPTGPEITFSRDSTSYKLQRNYSGFSNIPVEHMTVTSPFQDGATLLDSRLLPRDISFEVLVMAADLEALQVLIRALASSFNPAGGTGHLFYTDEAGNEFWISAIGNNTPKPTNDKCDTNWRVYIDLVAFDPYWYSGTKKISYLSSLTTNFFPLTITTAFLGWNSSSKVLENLGDMETPVTITIAGECVNPVLTNVETGEVISIALSMAAGDRFVITTGFGNKTATYYPAAGGSENGMPYLAITSILWNLQPGENTITLTDTSIAAGTYVSIEWYDRYTVV